MSSEEAAMNPSPSATTDSGVCDNLLDEIEAPVDIPQSEGDEEYDPYSDFTRCSQTPKSRQFVHNFKPITLNFTKKFATKSGKLSAIELEELLTVKITEAIVYREQNTKLRGVVDRHVSMIESLSRRLTNIAKNYQDLVTIHRHAITRFNSNPDAPPQVLKITRAVGVQSYEQEVLPGEIYTIDLDSPERDHRNPFNRSPVRSPSPTTEPVFVKGSRAKRKLEMEKQKKADEKRRKRRKKTTTKKPLLSLNSTFLETSKRPNSDPVDENRRKTRRISEDDDLTLNETLEMPTIIMKSPKKLPNGIKSSEIVENLKEAAEKFSKDNEEENAKNKSINEPNAPENHQKHLETDSTTPQEAASDTFKAPQSFTISEASRPLASSTPMVFNPQQQHHDFSYPDLSPSPLLPPLYAPLPQATKPQFLNPAHKKVPPKPKISIEKSEKGIALQWRIDDLDSAVHADIEFYQIYSYEINSEALPASGKWEFVGDVNALLLPMAVTLSKFGEGQQFYFAVRAVDCHRRMSEFSEPKTWEKC